MHFLVVTQYFWPENFRINELVEGFVKRNHEITVLTGHPNYPAGRWFDGYGPIHPIREYYSGARVLRVPLVPRGSGGGVRLIFNYLSFALTASIAGPLMVSEHIDAIIVYEPSPITVGFPAMVLKAFTNAPVLFWLQDLWPESLSATGAISSPAVLKAVELMVRWLYKGCDLIMVQSKAFVPSVLRLGGPLMRTRYFPNSAESFYRPVSVPPQAPELDLMPEGFRITFAGNVGAAQDFDTIIRAALILQKQPDIQFVIIGDGRMLGKVKASVKALGLENTVHLLGRHPADRMPFFFALSDALLVTLRKDPIFALTIPSKVQAYLACGRPIIAALDGEGARVIEQAGAGLTCEAQSPERLAEAILSIYHMTEAERAAMGYRGRALFERDFEHESLLDRLEQWLVDLTGANHAG